MHGVSSDYLIVRNWPIHSGEFFTDRDVHVADQGLRASAHTLVGKLFQTTDPIGQSVRIKNIPFRVIGVLARKGANMVGEDQDNIILMPCHDGPQAAARLGIRQRQRHPGLGPLGDR